MIGKEENSRVAWAEMAYFKMSVTKKSTLCLKMCNLARASQQSDPTVIIMHITVGSGIRRTVHVCTEE